MDSSDELGAAAQHAAAAMRTMAQHKIPATPENFTVWYAYVSDQEPDLKNALDALIAKDQAFTRDQNAKIFQKYFGQFDNGAAVHEASDKMAELTAKVLAMVTQASDEAQEFGAVLADSAGSLDDSQDASVVKQVVKALAGETQKMLAQNRQLQEKLETSSQQIESLKVNLENVQKEALTDGLTEIANRKGFDLTLQTQTVRALETGTSLCLILADIDHFKKFNDTHGHQTGDRVLKLVSSVLSQSVRTDDTPARYGGEEFAVILPDTDLRSAVALAESVRAAVARKRLRKKQTGEEIGNVTLSFGVAKFRPGEPETSFIKRADDGLYRAKHLGRNRVVSESEANWAAD